VESPVCTDYQYRDAIRNDPDFRLIETFGYRPGQGIARLDLHLARMARSAEALGIVIDMSAAKSVLAQVGGAEPLRCRLTLDARGGVDLTTAVFPAPIEVMRFKIAETVLESRDVWLRHKTTRRQIYDVARATLPLGVDELVFLNERGEVCEGTITNISITTLEGDHLTPPLSSGCLPGVYRQSRLDQRLLREAVLTVSDLKAAKSIKLVNSLRGSTQASWVLDDENTE
jgi:4-amino-4-deoxychorismate lyase